MTANGAFDFDVRTGVGLPVRIARDMFDGVERDLGQADLAEILDGKVVGRVRVRGGSRSEGGDERDEESSFHGQRYSESDWVGQHC